MEDGKDSSKQERLEKLAHFQVMMIKHAMKCEFPPRSPTSKPSAPIQPDIFSTCDIVVVSNVRGAALRISDVAVGMSSFVVSTCDGPAPNLAPSLSSRSGRYLYLYPGPQTPGTQCTIYNPDAMHISSPLCEEDRLLNM